jgi:hypothetical protein
MGIFEEFDKAVEKSTQDSKNKIKEIEERSARVFKLKKEYKRISLEERNTLYSSQLSEDQRAALDLIKRDEAPPTPIKNGLIIISSFIVFVIIIHTLGSLSSQSDYTSDGQYRPQSGSEKVQIVKFIISIFRRR